MRYARNHLLLEIGLSVNPACPSVTVSSGKPARGFTPVSTLMPGRMPPTVRASASGVPPELFGPQYPGGKIVNGAAFTPAPAGQQGNLGRNVLRGFAAFQIDVAIQRRFQLTQGVDLRFRTELFNIFNHPNFGPPNIMRDSSGFGQILSAGNARIVQFGLKFYF